MSYYKSLLIFLLIQALFACTSKQNNKKYKQKALLIEFNGATINEESNSIKINTDSVISNFSFTPSVLDRNDTIYIKILNQFIDLYVNVQKKDTKGAFWAGVSPKIKGSNFTVFNYDEHYTASFNLDSLHYEISGYKGNFKVKKIEQNEIIEEDEPLFDDYESSKNLLNDLDDEVETELISEVDILAVFTTKTKNTLGLDGLKSRLGLAIEQTNLSLSDLKKVSIDVWPLFHS